MYKCKLALAVSKSFDIPALEQIKLFKKIGFEGFFTEWDGEECISQYKTLADELNIEYQSLHAPFYKAADMWKSDESARVAVDELLQCLDTCFKYSIPILVVHPYIGFDLPLPNQYGVENFGTVIKKAANLNVTVAFENVEGEEYLECLMNAFRDYDNVGFCYDSGHEMCYNRGNDMLNKYGHRLVATHLNDNLGISRNSGEIYWTDDLHLLPFDGIANWQNISKKLSDLNYDGMLTFELVRKSKPDRHDNDKYLKLSIEEYLAEAYARACRIAAFKAYFDEKHQCN